MAQDIIGALIAILSEDAAVRALVLDAEGLPRVFGAELPREVVGESPSPTNAVKSIVLRRAPGFPGLSGTIDLEEGSILVANFGETPNEADKVRRASHAVLKQLLRQRRAGCLIHSLDLVGAAESLRDADTKWPLALETWRCLASEVQTP